jgi:hypothetical protein
MTSYSNRVAMWAEATIGASLGHPERFASLEALEGRVMELVAIEQFARGHGRSLACPRFVVTSYAEFLRKRYTGTQVRSVLQSSEGRPLDLPAATELLRHVLRHARASRRPRELAPLQVEIAYESGADPSPHVLDRHMERLRSCLLSLALDGTAEGRAHSELVEGMDWELVDVAVPLPADSGVRIVLSFGPSRRATWLSESVVRVALGYLAEFFAGDVRSLVNVDALVGVQALRLVPSNDVRLIRISGPLLRGSPPIDVFASLADEYRARLEASLSVQRFRATSRVVCWDADRGLLVLAGEPAANVFVSDRAEALSVGADVRVLGKVFTSAVGRSFLLADRVQVL